MSFRPHRGAVCPPLRPPRGYLGPKELQNFIVNFFGSQISPPEAPTIPKQGNAS